MKNACRLPSRHPTAALIRLLSGNCRAAGFRRATVRPWDFFFAGEFAEAAIRLEGIAEDMRIGRGMPVRGDERTTASAGMLADTFRQAANAWLRGRELERAEAAIGQALAIVPENTALEHSIREDRAYIAAAEGDYALALEELDFLYRSNRRRTDLLLFIASAARALEDYARADTALAQYLDAYPDDPSAYLELGNLKDAQNDRPAARQAWLKVLALGAGGSDAEAARTNLERIDVSK